VDTKQPEQAIGPGLMLLLWALLAAAIVLGSWLGDAVAHVREYPALPSVPQEAPTSPRSLAFPDDLPRARNLLVVLVDTLRADRLRIYNPATRVRTPNLSRLARSSVVFERAMAPESWTKPSVTSLLTGLYPDRHRVQTHGSALPVGVAYAPEVLGEQGFVTAAFVGNGYISRQHGFARGWDTWQTFDGATGANTARHIVDAAIRWLRARPSDQRFFAYVHTVDPHAPYAAPLGFRHLYVQSRYRGMLRPTATARVLRDHGAGRLVLHRRDLQRLEDLYDGEVAFHDLHLGRLMDALTASGLARDTLVVVTADHGEEFLDHGRLGHGHSVHEELVRVPLVVRLPGGSLRGRVAADVGLTDVLPTACDLLGIRCPEEVDGLSLVETMLDPAAGNGAPVFTAAASAGLNAVRAGRFKAVCGSAGCELFDLEVDPREMTGVSAIHTAALAELRDALDAHLGRMSATVANGSVAPVRPGGSEIEMDDESRRQLVALGYLDD
jgi:arylsulfatase A-like enzyme